MKQAIAALLLACMPFAAAAQDATEAKEPILWGEVGNWAVRMDPGLGNACFVVSVFDTGHLLIVGRYFKPGKPGFFLSIQNEKWKSLVHGQLYSVSVQFGENDLWDAKTAAFKEGGVHKLIITSDDTDFLEQFKSSNIVKMFYEDKEIARLSLSGVEKAVDQMDACQKTTDEILKTSRTEPDTSDPFAKNPSKQASDDPFKP